MKNTPSQPGLEDVPFDDFEKEYRTPAPELGNGQADECDDSLIRDVCLTDVKMQPIEWLWEGWIPLGALSIVEGIEGEGKSTLLCEIAAALTQGRALPSGYPTQPGRVLWIAAEDDAARVLKPRLLAAGAREYLVFVITEPFSLDGKGLLALRERIAVRQPSLVVFDPIFSFTPGDANKGVDSRRLTNQLKLIAEQFKLAMVLVRHVGKSKGLGDPRAAGLYSIEWRAAARCVLLVGSDPDNQDKRALTQTKNNFGPKAEALGYEIIADQFSVSGARFSWTGPSQLTANRILATMGNDEEQSGRREAEDFLRDALADGEKPAKQVQKDARTAGISETTLNRTKRALQVRSRKSGGNFGGDVSWYWSLP
jgi:hypothetical protein